jgi:hypothetical protein
LYILPVHLVRMKAARLRRKILRDAVPYRRFSNRAEGRATRATMGQAPGVLHEDPCERCCCGVALHTRCRLQRCIAHRWRARNWRRRDGRPRSIRKTPAHSHCYRVRPSSAAFCVYRYSLCIKQPMNCRAYLRQRRWTAKLMNCRTYEVHNLFRLQTSVNPLQQGSRDKSSRTHPPAQRHRRRSDSTRRLHAAGLSAHRLEPRQPHASNRFLRSCLDRKGVFDDV